MGHADDTAYWLLIGNERQPYLLTEIRDLLARLTTPTYLPLVGQKLPCEDLSEDHP